jgi:hypothetical protein
MKKYFLPFYLVIINLQTAFAVVNTLLTLEDHQYNTPTQGIATLIINVESYSTTVSAVDINIFEDTFRIGDNLRPYVKQVLFSDQNFPASHYSHNEDYQSNGRVNYEYSFNNGTRSSITGSGNWTLIVRVTILYSMVSDSSNIYWNSGSPQYLVTDENNNIITGIELPIPINLTNILLPVELSFFSANPKDDIVELFWQTQTEFNNYGFEIERVISNNIPDSQNWNKIGFVFGNGNSNSIKNYSFKDKNPVGGNKFIYRLKQIDNDGTFSYSNEVEAELLINKFELSQNYPNPFNPSTVIKYSLADASYIKLTVYDILGREIKVLINESKEPGNYELNFNGTSLESGVYIYRLETKDFTKSQRMVLLK